MKIAIIGTGIAGNVLAYHLHQEHDIAVFEANDYIGGHSHTHDIVIDDEQQVIDTGFIVFNYRTYPQFTALLDKLGVKARKSDMSFSVKCELSGLEYNGKNLNTLFAQRRNLLRPSFYRMIRDILRFNRTAPELLHQPHNQISLGEYLQQQNFGEAFISQYIIPMGSAIWSSSFNQMMAFPAQLFIRFFANHGLLSVNDHPDWYVIDGGSRNYVAALSRGYRNRIRLNEPVHRIDRKPGWVEISGPNTQAEKFDYVFMACHADQALTMLGTADAFEREILNAFPYQQNEAVLHTDASILPRQRRAWAAWNYHRRADFTRPAAVTYNMNILQGLRSRHTFCVTLNNNEAIDESRILRRMQYAHPLFTERGMLAQQRHCEINGHHRCFYAGAYWRYGFHEDGVISAIHALQHFNEHLGYEQQTVRRAG